MKTFLIPALFVVLANDKAEADNIAGGMQMVANRLSDTAHLLLDEELPTTEIPNIPPENDLPHTINVYGSILQGLQRQKFNDWYNRKFADYIGGNGNTSEQEMIQDLEKLFPIKP